MMRWASFSVWLSVYEKGLKKITGSCHSKKIVNILSRMNGKSRLKRDSSQSVAEALYSNLESVKLLFGEYSGIAAIQSKSQSFTYI